jgi:hypothetical protein
MSTIPNLRTLQEQGNKNFKLLQDNIVQMMTPVCNNPFISGVLLPVTFSVANGSGLANVLISHNLNKIPGVVNFWVMSQSCPGFVFMNAANNASLSNNPNPSNSLYLQASSVPVGSSLTCSIYCF